MPTWVVHLAVEPRTESETVAASLLKIGGFSVNGQYERLVELANMGFKVVTVHLREHGPTAIVPRRDEGPGSMRIIRTTVRSAVEQYATAYESVFRAAWETLPRPRQRVPKPFGNSSRTVSNSDPDPDPDPETETETEEREIQEGEPAASLHSTLANSCPASGDTFSLLRGWAEILGLKQATDEQLAQLATGLAKYCQGVEGQGLCRRDQENCRCRELLDGEVDRVAARGSLSVADKVELLAHQLAVLPKSPGRLALLARDESRTPASA